MHKIPSDSDPRAEVRRRRQRWIKFVNQTRKHWTPGKTSSICSVHFKHEDFTRPFNSNLKRVLREDEFGVCVWPAIHVGKRASKNEHKGSPTKRQKRIASKLLLDLLLSPRICHVFYSLRMQLAYLEFSLVQFLSLLKQFLFQSSTRYADIQLLDKCKCRFPSSFSFHMSSLCNVSCLPLF